MVTNGGGPLKVIKQSLNTDTEHFVRLSQKASTALEMFTQSDEAQEGINAFNERGQPDFAGFLGLG